MIPKGSVGKAVVVRNVASNLARLVNRIGKAIALKLAEQGADVLVTDEASEDALTQSKDQLKDFPINFHLGGHREEDFTDADLIVASPAVPPKSRYLELARRHNIPITTEIRLFIERCAAPINGVTGTKGKSTTTALLGEMLRQKYTTHVGGNIGRSLLFDLPNIKSDHQVVLEISSFMLEYLREIGVVSERAPVGLAGANRTCHPEVTGRPAGSRSIYVTLFSRPACGARVRARNAPRKRGG